MTAHKHSPLYFLCEPCTEIRKLVVLMLDIQEGRLEVPELHDEEGQSVE